MTYYVATTGKDTNPGTAASPFLTIQRGVNAAAAGDTVLVKSGVYGSNNVGVNGFPVQINSAGSASAPITLKSEVKWGAVLDGGLNCHSYILLLGNASYWVIQDFDITRGYWAGIWSNSTAHHIAMKGNHLHHIGNRNETLDLGIEGFYSGADSHDLVMDGNTFNDIGRTNILPQGPNHDHGVYAHAKNFGITNNIFYNNVRGWAIQCASGSNWMIACNTFALANPGRAGYIVLWDPDGVGTVSGVTVRNNIFCSVNSCAIGTALSGPVVNCIADYNIVQGSSTVVESASSGVVVQNNLLNKDPLLVNPVTVPYDWHLRQSSPAINAAIDVPGITQDYYGLARPQGTSYDIGAAEFASAPPPTNKPLTIQITWNGDIPISTVKVTGT